MTSERNAHRTLYNRIQHMTCKAGCSDCCGVISITEKSIVLRCPKCGDAKGVFPKPEVNP